jgi:hypothetical protein
VCDEGCCEVPVPLSFGVVVVVEVDDVVEDDELVELVLDDEGELLVVAAGLHVADLALNGPLIGSGDEGDSTLNVSVCPLRSVTVTVHDCAEALGNAAIAFTANTVQTAATATVSLRLLNTVA